VSFVSQASIATYEKRAPEKSWNDLSGLTSSLPHPLAAPLANYVSSEPAKLAQAAREFGESALTLAAYLAFIEYCARKGRGSSHLFKGFTKRSAGPLWKLFRESMDAGGKSMVVCAPLRELTDSPLYGVIDRFVTEIAKEKHGKLSSQDMDTLRPVQILANVLQRVFTETKFGLFQQVQKQRFEKNFQGLFRHATGRFPFLTVFRYSGELSFAQDEAFLVTSGKGLPLQPLVFWNACPKHPELDCGHCYLFDSQEGSNVFSFKAAGFSCTCVAAPQNDLAPLAAQLAEFVKEDQQIGEIHIGNLPEIEDASAGLII
jgi:hypothetical protein